MSSRIVRHPVAHRRSPRIESVPPPAERAEANGRFGPSVPSPVSPDRIDRVGFEGVRVRLASSNPRTGADEDGFGKRTVRP
ncbi:MAG TPA: hypothetical protein DCQ98_07150 [Planctomycetaceae bacterium]|nr:hypothetical protein [Planctomycetaceae bacterium]